jgi:integrase
MKTEIYVRHRDTCTDKGGRQNFDGCPVYARYRVRDLHTGEVLENFHGSLKGITNQTAATEYVENRFMRLRNRTLAKRGKTVAEAGQAYIADKQRELAPVPYGEISDRMLQMFKRQGRPVPTEREHESVKKLKVLLGRFVEFCDERKIAAVTDVSYDHLTEFLNIRHGRTVSVVKDGEIVDRITMPPVDATRKYNQSLIKGWFRWMRLHEMIEVNPAELLRTIKKTVKPKTQTSEEQQEKLWTPEMIAKVVSVIPAIHERPQRLLAYFKILVYAAPRISDIAAMEVAKLDDGGITYWNHKTGGWVYAALPPSLVRHMRIGFKPRSEKYFFWTGNGKHRTISGYYSGKLLEAYRAAGVPEKYQGGPRSHEFRDTTGTKLMEQIGGRLEDAQLALNHSKRDTTEEHYVEKTKLRYAQVNQKKREMWEAEGMWE